MLGSSSSSSFGGGGGGGEKGAVCVYVCREGGNVPNSIHATRSSPK